MNIEIKEVEIDTFLNTDAREDELELGNDDGRSTKFGPTGTEKADQSCYNIRNYPKLPSKPKNSGALAH
jgi:hypothetical protein